MSGPVGLSRSGLLWAPSSSQGGEGFGSSGHVEVVFVFFPDICLDGGAHPDGAMGPVDPWGLDGPSEIHCSRCSGRNFVPDGSSPPWQSSEAHFLTCHQFSASRQDKEGRWGWVYGDGGEWMGRWVEGRKKEDENGFAFPF